MAFDLEDKLLDKLKELTSGLQTGRLGRAARFKFNPTNEAYPFNCLALKDNGPCYGFMKQVDWSLRDTDILCVSFNGESPADKGPGGIAGCGLEENFKGGKLSRLWLDFIMDEKGPWADVIPHIANRHRKDEINNGCFVFGDLPNLQNDLTYSFLIASRFAQEQNRFAKRWYELVTEHNLDPKFAYIFTRSYQKWGEKWINQGGANVHTILGSPSKTWVKVFFYDEKRDQKYLIKDNPYLGVLAGTQIDEIWPHQHIYSKMVDWTQPYAYAACNWPTVKTLDEALNTVREHLESK